MLILFREHARDSFENGLLGLFAGKLPIGELIQYCLVGRGEYQAFHANGSDSAGHGLFPS